MGCQRYPPSSDASKSREHPYEAYTSCQLWSSPAYMSFTGASIPALATGVGGGFYISFGGPGFELLPNLSALAAALDSTALFLLLVLAMPPRGTTPFLQPSAAQPVGPTS